MSGLGPKSAMCQSTYLPFLKAFNHTWDNLHDILCNPKTVIFFEYTHGRQDFTTELINHWDNALKARNKDGYKVIIGY
jgi:hypothetical protein